MVRALDTVGKSAQKHRLRRPPLALLLPHLTRTSSGLPPAPDKPLGHPQPLSTHSNTQRRRSPPSEFISPSTMVEIALPRRRSVDVGGLALALNDATGALGHGWGGWDEEETGETRYASLFSHFSAIHLSSLGYRYAEVLIDVRAHTETIVNHEPIEV